MTHDLPRNDAYNGEPVVPADQRNWGPGGPRPRSALVEPWTPSTSIGWRAYHRAASVGTERLREIMAELVERCAAVVKRYGGTVDKFTGDGIMAVFGAPVALEDHAVRACLAGLAIQEEARQLAVDVQDRDGVELQLRVGLNSGQVIAGEIGSGLLGYTAFGEQVGMAQRMESVAPPSGVMLNESTARLVEDTTVLGEPELVRIKGSETPVAARRLLAISEHQPYRRSEAALVGRAWELNTIPALLDEAIAGAGCVVNIVGAPGIGKSRLVRESAAVAARRGLAVSTTYCESHTSDVPFHAISRLLRAGMEIHDLDESAARTRVHGQFSDADREDLRLLDDLLGIADPTLVLRDIAPDARRRRLTALIKAAALYSDRAGGLRDRRCALDAVGELHHRRDVGVHPAGEMTFTRIAVLMYSTPDLTAATPPSAATNAPAQPF